MQPRVCKEEKYLCLPRYEAVYLVSWLALVGNVKRYHGPAEVSQQDKLSYSFATWKSSAK